MNFWKEHAVLRMVLMWVFFVCGVTLTVVGWKMTGQLTGLFLMLVGLALLIGTLFLYNKPYETPKTKK